MSIRLKVFLIIVAIVMVITASSVLISISSAQNQILETLESDMKLVASLANEYISGEIQVLKTEAATVAQVLKTTKFEEVQPVLMERVAAHEQFSAIAVFNEFGKIEASYPPGASIPPEDTVLGEELGKAAMKAMNGHRVVSSSHLNASGHVVFYVFVPMDDYYFQTIIGEKDPHPRIVACTVPGEFFSERVNRFMIWETGNIAIVDNEGYIIANVRQDWVSARLNFLEKAGKDSRYEDTARVFHRMINLETGTDRIMLEGEDSVFAFRPIALSEQGWSIAVIAPVAESPFFKVRAMIAISGIVFLALGLIAAVLASGFIAMPFCKIREQNIELLRIEDSAKAAANAKSAFLANMSHEMRTPLNTIIGLSEISLRKEGLQKDVGVCLNKICNTGETLLDVVNNLLDISNMESGKFELVTGAYYTAAFINETVNANTIHIGPKPINFNLILGGNIPAQLSGDVLRIKQIFNNLLSNAFIYTKEGTVEWKITAEKESGPSGPSVWLISTISDTGPGIKPEDIVTIFDDYKNLSAWKDISKGGGMGLPLTRRMVELMGGTIIAESIYGKGSAFTVKIRQKYVNDAVISSDTVENLTKFQYS